MYKPIYHFIPGKNWMNDPNGLCWYKGKYHLFYQYNPTGDQWGNLHWGHAVSEDCVHWELLKEAIAPSKDKGEVYCFSGCVSTEGDKPVLYYTSVGEEAEGRDSRNGAQQWCAFSEDEMYTWKKYEKNPILTKEVHGSLNVLEWRDPYVWKEEDSWYMVLGAEIAGCGAVLLYQSEDQLHWTFCHVLMQSRSEENRIYECPNFFYLKGKAVLVVSPNDMPCYWIGTMDQEHYFSAEQQGIIDHSGWDGFYAPNSFEDHKGRRIMIGWLTENGRGKLKIPGWQGVQSLPRELSIENDILYMRPIEELKQLRGNYVKCKEFDINETWRSPIESRSAEIIVETEVESIKDRLEIIVFADSKKTEQTVIRYDKWQDQIVIDRGNSNGKGMADTKLLSCRGTHSDDGKLRLHIFIDQSVLEVFINEREVISTRVYTYSDKSREICIKGNASLDKLEVYEMNSIW